MRKNLGKLHISAFCLLLILLFTGCSAFQTAPVQKSTVAMDSAVTVKLYSDNPETANTQAQAVLDAVSALDTKVLSKSVATSELSRLNASESPETLTKVSPELFSSLWETKEIYSRSESKASLASGVLTELWGIDTEDFRVPTDREITAAKALCSDETVTLTEDGCVAFQKGQKLNLGSVGKGIACDKAAAVLAENGFSSEKSGAVISVGGSLALVGSPEKGERFTVGVRNPFGAQTEYFATLKTDACFLSTSGSYEKKFEQNGTVYHHLLDLTTGYPAKTDLCAVTVKAKTGLQSDALSTLCFLLGQEKSLPILQEYNAEAVFVYTDKSVFATSGIYHDLQLTDSGFTLEAI